MGQSESYNTVILNRRELSDEEFFDRAVEQEVTMMTVSLNDNDKNIREIISAIRSDSPSQEILDHCETFQINPRVLTDVGIYEKEKAIYLEHRFKIVGVLYRGAMLQKPKFLNAMKNAGNATREQVFRQVMSANCSGDSSDPVELETYLYFLRTIIQDSRPTPCT